jgi:hypothetical protein
MTRLLAALHLRSLRVQLAGAQLTLDTDVDQGTSVAASARLA